MITSLMASLKMARFMDLREAFTKRSNNTKENTKVTLQHHTIKESCMEKEVITNKIHPSLEPRNGWMVSGSESKSDYFFFII